MESGRTQPRETWLRLLPTFIGISFFEGAVVVFVWNNLPVNSLASQILVLGSSFATWVATLWMWVVGVRSTNRTIDDHAGTLWYHAHILMAPSGSLAYWFKACAAAAGTPPYLKLRGNLESQLGIIHDAMIAQRAAGRKGFAEFIGERLLTLCHNSFLSVRADSAKEWIRVLDSMLAPLGLKFQF